MTHPSSNTIVVMSSLDVPFSFHTSDGAVALDHGPELAQLRPDVRLAEPLLVLECQPGLVSHGDTPIVTLYSETIRIFDYDNNHDNNHFRLP